MRREKSIQGTAKRNRISGIGILIIFLEFLSFESILMYRQPPSSCRRRFGSNCTRHKLQHVDVGILVLHRNPSFSMQKILMKEELDPADRFLRRIGSLS